MMIAFGTSGAGRAVRATARRIGKGESDESGEVVRIKGEAGKPADTDPKDEAGERQIPDPDQDSTPV